MFTFLHILLDLLQLNLSETAKHWDSFLTHCISSSAAASHVLPSPPPVSPSCPPVLERTVSRFLTVVILEYSQSTVS